MPAPVIAGVRGQPVKVHENLAITAGSSIAEITFKAVLHSVGSVQV